MKTMAAVVEWLQGAEAQFGDPAIAVTQTFFRFVAETKGYRGEELVFSMKGPHRLELAGITPDGISPHGALCVQVDVSMDGPDLRGDELLGFGVERIAPGLWSLNPSLNMPGSIHTFVTLYDVPDPAPWENRIILAG